MDPGAGERTPHAGSAGIRTAAAAADDGESWTPGPEHRDGHWRTGRPLPDFVTALLDYQEPVRDRIAALRARIRRDWDGGPDHRPPPVEPAPPRRGVTGVGGTVLRLNDQPLANVTVSAGGKSARTDAHGRFELTGLPQGHHELIVDGSTANGPGREYLQFSLGVEVGAGRLTELTHALYVPRIQPSDWVDLPAPTPADTVVTHPKLSGVEIHIPKDTVFRDQAGKIVTRIALVPVPLDRAPYPVPDAFPVYFMLHPGGAVVQALNSAASGIRIVYPNATHDQPGTEHHLWVYDSRQAGWTVYGTGQVSADGSHVEPDHGVGLHEHMGAGHSITGAPPAPPPGPPADGDCGGSGGGPGGGGPGGGSGPSPSPGEDGDPVDCYTGLFLHQRTDAVLADDLPLEIQRTYRTNDTISRDFGKGTNHRYGLFLRQENLTIPSTNACEKRLMRLVLPDGGRVDFPWKSGTNLHTNCAWEHTATPSAFYGARLTAPATGGERWVITLKNGTVYEFGLNGRLIGTRDRTSNRLYFTYSGSSLLRATTQNGRYVDFTRDTAGRITQIKDLLGRTWRYDYYPAGTDGDGYLQKVTYPDNSFEEYTYYPGNGGMKTVKDRRGHLQVTNEYYANGRVMKQTLADGGTYQFAYTLDATGNATQADVTTPRGFVRRRQFNGAGYVTSLTSALGQPEEQTVLTASRALLRARNGKTINYVWPDCFVTAYFLVAVNEVALPLVSTNDPFAVLFDGRVSLSTE